MAEEKTTPTNTTVSDSEQKVEVRSAPMIKSDEGNSQVAINLSAHHEISANHPVAEVVVKPDKPENEPKKLDTPGAVDLSDSAERAPSPAPPVDDSPKQGEGLAQPIVEQQNLAGQKNTEIQTPRIFDTKQYHLPINDGVASGKGKYLLTIFILLVVISGAMVAIDAELFDIGLKLPFDFIK